jgi:hypothetical protein
MKGSLKVIFLVGMVTCLFLIYVHGQVMLLHLSYEINARNHATNQKLEEYRRLKFQVDQLKAPRILETKMKDLALDLIPPKEIKVVRIPQAPKAVAPAVARMSAHPLTERLNQFLGRWISVAQAKTDN